MNQATITNLLNKALKLHHQGQHDDADKIYKSILEIDRDNFDANHLHGCILSQKEKHEEALIYFFKALKKKQDNYEVNNNIGIAYKNLNNLERSEKFFLAAINIDDTNYKALFNCANVYIKTKDFNKSINFLVKSINCNNNFAESHQRLGETYQQKFKLDKNIKHLASSKLCFEKSLMIDPTYADSCISLAITMLWLGQIDEADEYFKRALKLNHSNDDYISSYFNSFQNDKTLLKTLVKHEFEQITFIDSDKDGIRNMKFSSDYYTKLKIAYSDLQDPEYNIDRLNLQDIKSISKILYNKPPIYSGNKLLGNNNFADLQSKYFSSNPEILVVDDLLTKEALEQLQRFCRSANIFKYPYHNGYVGAFLSKGLSNKFILHLTDQIRQSFGEIFNNLRLTQAWIFKYDSKSKGINIHADQAAVNVNFWITQSEANLNSQNGGLTVWNRVPPKDWSFEDYNYVDSSPKIEKILKDNDVPKVNIEYKENRAVIFNSKLFHATDNYEFKDNYADKRVNITFLYE